MLFSCQAKAGNLWTAKTPSLLSLLPSLRQRRCRSLLGWNCIFCTSIPSPAGLCQGRRVDPHVPPPGDGGPRLQCLTLKPALWVRCFGDGRTVTTQQQCHGSPMGAGHRFLLAADGAQCSVIHSSDCLRPFLLLFLLPAAWCFLPNQCSFLQALPTVPFSKSTPVLQLNFCWDAHGGLTLQTSPWRYPSLCSGFLSILYNQRALLGERSYFYFTSYTNLSAFLLA